MSIYGAADVVTLLRADGSRQIQVTMTIPTARRFIEGSEKVVMDTCKRIAAALDATAPAAREGEG